MEEKMEENPIQDPSAEQEEMELGPRRLTFLSLVLKTFAGFAGGIAGTGILLLIFLAASSILQPALGPEAQGTVNPLFMVVVIGMIFGTSLISSILSTLFLSYTERDRYTRIATTIAQVFLLNFVIFLFALPIYLTTSATNFEVLAFSAALQIILSALASALVLELMVDFKYALLAVYSTILAVLVSSGLSFIFFNLTGNATILMFIALPLLWSSIGFFQAAVGIFYRWVYLTWGTDYLASETALGTDYGIPDTTEEEMEEEQQREDLEGGDFMKQ